MTLSPPGGRVVGLAGLLFGGVLKTLGPRGSGEAGPPVGLPENRLGDASALGDVEDLGDEVGLGSGDAGGSVVPVIRLGDVDGVVDDVGDAEVVDDGEGEVSTPGSLGVAALAESITRTCTTGTE